LAHERNLKDFATMNHLGARRGLLTVCLCAAAGWTALSPAGASFSSHAAFAAPSSECVRPPSATLSSNAAATPAPASPVASPGATPVAQAAAAIGGQAAQTIDQTTSSMIEQLVATVAACQTKRDYKTLAELVTPGFITEVYGGGTELSTVEFIQLGADLPAQTVTIKSINDLSIDDKGVIGADVVSIAGHQLLNSRWTFIARADAAGDDTGVQAGQVSGAWAVNSLTPQAVKIARGAKQFDVNVSDTALSPATLSAKRGVDVVLNGANSGKQDHELLALKLPKGMTVGDLLLATGPAFPKGVEFVGQVTIPTKSKGQLVLTGFARGSYVVVDMLPDEDGIPYLAKGFSSTLKIT